MLLGGALLLSAALLLGNNRREESQAAVQAEAALKGIQGELSGVQGLMIPFRQGTAQAETEAPEQQTAPQEEQSASTEMPTMEIDGREYIGYLELPTLGLSLPVLSEWSYAGLRVAPCRYWGSTRDDSLVILAHNYARHFGALQSLAIGDVVQLVDAEGTISQYAVEKLEILERGEVRRMVDSEYDLTLFTCTYGGRQRVTVRLNRTDRAG